MEHRLFQSLIGSREPKTGGKQRTRDCVNGSRMGQRRSIEFQISCSFLM